MTVGRQKESDQRGKGLALVKDGAINPLEKLVGEQNAITITLTSLSRWAKDYLAYYNEVYDPDKAIGAQEEKPHAGYIFHEGDSALNTPDVHGIEVPNNLGELLESDSEGQMREIIRSMVIARRNITAIAVARKRGGKEVTPKEIDRSVELRIRRFMMGVKRIERKQTLNEFLYDNLIMTETQ